MGEGAGHTRVRACIQTPRTHGKSGTEECSCLPGVQHGRNPGSLQPTSPADTASKRPVPNKVQSEEHPNVHNPHVCSYKQHTYVHTNNTHMLIQTTHVCSHKQTRKSEQITEIPASPREEQWPPEGGAGPRNQEENILTQRHKSTCGNVCS